MLGKGWARFKGWAGDKGEYLLENLDEQDVFDLIGVQKTFGDLSPEEQLRVQSEIAKVENWEAMKWGLGITCIILIAIVAYLSGRR